MAQAIYQTTPLLVPDDFQGHQLIVFVIQALGHLSKGPFPDHLQNLIAVGNVVMQDLQKPDQGKEQSRRLWGVPDSGVPVSGPGLPPGELSELHQVFVQLQTTSPYCCIGQVAAQIPGFQCGIRKVPQGPIHVRQCKEHWMVFRKLGF